MIQDSQPSPDKPSPDKPSPDKPSKDTSSPDKLIDSLNDSAKHVSTLTITFLATCIYIVIAIAATTHEALLVGTEVNLPLLNVKVPLEKFFVIAPLLLVLLHLHLLLQEYFLFRKAAAVERLAPLIIEDGQATRFFPVLAVNSYFGFRYRRRVRLILRILRFLIHYALVLLLLCWIQVRFLPYHSWRITLFHQILVGGDAALIGYYGRKLSLFRSWPHTQRWLRRYRSPIIVVVLLLITLFSVLVAVVPGTGSERLLRGALAPFSNRFQRNLQLREKRLSKAKPPLEGTAQSPAGSELSDVPALDLRDRDLRFADFTGAGLIGADFRGADLRGAVLTNADLRGADFTPSGGADGRFGGPPSNQKLRLINEAAQLSRSFQPTRLGGAKLQNARLQRARLILADLTGADLQGAHLEESELTQASLRRAILYGAWLNGAELSRSRLDGSMLVEARLTGARLFEASLVGANLQGAYLEATDFMGSDLDAAHLVSAHLEGALFGGSSAVGADFRDASLQGSASLNLDTIDLRSAKLRGVDFCGQHSPTLTDLRQIDFVTPPRPSWLLIGQQIPLNGARPEARQRFRKAMQRNATCFVAAPPILPVPVAHLQLLYYEEQIVGPMSNWPAPQTQSLNNAPWNEDAFLVARSRRLVDAGCSASDVRVLRALGWQAANMYRPIDDRRNWFLASALKERFGAKGSCPVLDQLPPGLTKRLLATPPSPPEE